MGLIDEIAKTTRVVARQVYVAGQPIEPLAITIDLGYDIVSASASVQVATVPAASDFRQELEIWLGWNGFTIACFKGYIEDDGRHFFPFDNIIRAAGFNKRTQAKYPDAVSYSSQTDGAIVENLLTRAGLTNYAVAADGTTLGTVQAVTLAAGTPTWDLINQIDQVFGYKTFDTNDGFVRRMRISGLPSTSAAFAFVQGTNILSIERRMGSVDDINNRVNVYGLPQDTISWPTTRQAINVLVANPPQYIAYDFRSELVETSAVASAVALRLMGEVNGIPDEVTFETWGHPYLQPGMTVSITSAQIGLSSATNYWVKHVTHQFDTSGFYTRVVCERRIGDLGEEVNKAPIAAFSYRVSKETYDVGGSQTLMYTVTCDASSSWDPDGPPSALTYSWANNKNADTGTAVRYATSFTQAQLDAGNTTITLPVNDADADSSSATKTITITTDDAPILERALFVAASQRAEATPDGGATWNTWTPAAGTVVSTPEIANGYGLFGLSNGKLMHTADYLATAPTQAVDFGTQINAIWVHESNPDRVLCGCADGTLRATNNMSNIATSTWTTLYTAGAAINWIIEALDGSIRILTSNQVLISYDGGASFTEEQNGGVGATARRLALSNFASYVGFSGIGQGNVKRLSDGAQASGTSGTTGLLGLTHHIRDDILYAGGTGGKTFIKQASTLQFTTQGDLPASASGINHMVRDGDNQMVLYAAADGALAKSFTGGSTWVKMRDYTSVGLDGLMVGYESLNVVNTSGDGKVVMVIGIADGAPKAAYTTNILAANPTWNAATVGLPAGATKFRFLRLDPFDTSHAFAMIDNVLYQNTSWPTGGGWSTVANLSSVMQDMQFTIAASGLIYIHLVTTGAELWHSHNYGQTWTSLGTSGNNDLGIQIAVGQHNANKVFIPMNHLGPFGYHGSVFSTDGGHSITPGPEPNHLAAMFMSYGGNPNDDVVFSVPAGFGTQIYRNTSEGHSTGTTYTDLGVAIAGGRFYISPSDQHLWWGYEYGQGRFWLSRNTGASWSTVQPLGTTSTVFALLRDERWYGAASNAVGISTDGASWLVRTGNLFTGVFAATNKQIYDIAVDWLS